MKSINLLITSTLILLLAVACQKKEDPVEPSTPLVTIAETQLPNLSLDLKIAADQALFAGYNRLYAEVSDPAGKRPVGNLQIEVTPMMQMPTMTHSAPIEQTTGVDANMRYPFQVVFVMPGTTWRLEVQVTDPDNGVVDQVQIPITVESPTEARIRNLFTSDDSSRLFIALADPFNPEVGINDFNLTIHRRDGMMSWPAQEGLTIEIEPEMPSMGHGSPNNVHPEDQGNGHYKGKVNFTMDGWWVVHVRIFRQGQKIGETDFSITFQVK